MFYSLHIINLLSSILSYGLDGLLLPSISTIINCSYTKIFYKNYFATFGYSTKKIKNKNKCYIESNLYITFNTFTSPNRINLYVKYL
jgi:hypothetical protein